MENTEYIMVVEVYNNSNEKCVWDDFTRRKKYLIEKLKSLIHSLPLLLSEIVLSEAENKVMHSTKLEVEIY